VKSISDYEPGGREVTPTHLLLLLGEMEGTYQHLKYMGFYDDMKVIEDMKQKYYKLYFSTKKNK
tara:strand:- start:218 stop:409 length:192 start_codon:yes stop_codon:yes gene_type:complete